MRTMLRGKISLLFLAFTVLLAVPAVALADILETNVLAIEGDKTRYVKPNVSTTVNYNLQAQGGTNDTQNGCNATDGSPAIVTLNVPTNVTSNDSDNKITLSACNTGSGAVPVTFSSNTEGTYNITASVSDSGGGTYINNAAWTLVVDNTPPQVSSTDPANNATGVAVDKDFITATFNEKVDPATISGSTFSLTRPDTDADADTNPDLVPATVTYDAPTKTAKLDPTSNLDQNTLYTATLEGGATGSVVKDYAGNALASDYSWSFRTFNPNTAPELTLPANITAEATSAAGAVVNYTASATDAQDDPDPTPVCDPESGSTFPLGTTTVNCSVKDSGGLEDTGSFTVTVQDTTAPDLTVPGNITREATGPNGAAVDFSADVSATDLVDSNVDVTCNPASGSTFELGTTTVTCTATDDYNNSSISRFDVTVVDTTAPVISGMPSDITKEATSPNGAPASWPAPTASDVVDGNVPVNCSPNSGSTFALGTTEVTCTATDAAGNSSSAKFNVKVAYGWSGFLQPINTTTNMPTNYKQSIFKIGSTVPVKFQLTGASAGITDGNFYLKYIYTGSGDGVGESEVVAASTGNTGTQFRYDATAGQYIFNWSTKGITKAGNYEVKVYTDSNFTNLLGSQSIELKK